VTPLFKLGVAQAFGSFRAADKPLRALRHKMVAEGKLAPHLADPYPNVTLGDRGHAVAGVFKDAWTGLKAGHADNMSFLKGLWRKK
jgi:hypothetical protein